MSNPKALVTGITGQDGSYLAEHLLSQGYQVWGLIRGQANPRKTRVSRLASELEFVDGDLMDQASLVSAVDTVQPDEVYNLAAQSHVRVSFTEPEHTTQVTAIGAARILEALRLSEVPARFYQASSSEMFGATPPPQQEDTALHPRSPYGVSKVFAHWMTKNYREGFGMHAVSGILLQLRAQDVKVQFGRIAPVSRE